MNLWVMKTLKKHIWEVNTMLVSEMMITDVATVSENDSLNKAFQILYERNHKVLPVVKDGKLCGLLTDKLLSEVRPSKATSLSVYEINYLMSKTKVKDIMKPEVFTVSPEALIEDAASIMYTNDIGSLPVIRKDKTLVGIVTQTDIFKALIMLMGVNHEGTRIALETANDVGVVANITRILSEAKINISSISNYVKGENQHEIILKLDTQEIGDVPEKLSQAGYRITSVH